MAATYPTIVVSTKQDTLEVGEVYEAEISLSDTSLLYLPEIGGKKRRVLPVFKINGQIFYSESDTYVFREEVAHPNKGKLREWSCGIMFPHPIQGEGSVEILTVFSYVVEASSSNPSSQGQ